MVLLFTKLIIFANYFIILKNIFNSIILILLIINIYYWILIFNILLFLL